MAIYMVKCNLWEESGLPIVNWYILIKTNYQSRRKEKEWRAFTNDKQKVRVTPFYIIFVPF